MMASLAPDVPRSFAISSAAERLTVNFVILFSFFPFFRYIPFLEAESQPIAAFVAGLGLLVHGVDERATPRSLLALSVLIVAGSALSYLSGRSQIGPISSQTLAYICPILIATYLWGRLDLVSWTVVKWSALAHLIVGIAQFANVIPGPIDTLLSSSIYRYTSKAIAGGRGVVMLTNEPDYASRQILLALAFLIWFRLRERIDLRTFAIGFALAIGAMLVLNRSITGLGLLSILLLSWAFFRVPTVARLTILGTGALAALAGYQLLASYDFSQVTRDAPRAVQLAAVMMEGVQSGTLDFGTLVLFASARAMTDFAGIVAFLSQPLDGWGIGQGGEAVQKMIVSTEMLRYVPFDPSEFSSLKPTAYIICLLAEVGLPALIAVAWVAVSLVTELRAYNRKARERAFASACLALATVQLALTGPHSLPLPFILLVMAGTGLRSRYAE